MSEPGFLFMFGIYGTRAAPETVRRLKKSGACGVLLLARNIESAEQTRALSEELRQRVGRDLLFAVDHEGGWVLRFQNGVTAFPGNAALGATRDAELAFKVGEAMGRELSWLGVNLNLAPVLDVAQRYNPGIGIRSFGSDPALVARLGAAMIAGMQQNGVSACAKHFPGKGAARVDAHVALPTISLDKKAFEKTHLPPFTAAIEAGVDCVMTSHVRFPKFDRVPATFSKKITEDLLRGRLGFDGAVICDDLCMGAIAKDWPAQIAAAKALEAGHDILLIAHDAAAQEEAAELLAAQAAGDKPLCERIRRSRRRIERLFRRRKSAEARPLLAGALAEKIATLAVEVARQGKISLPLTPEREPLLVLFPDFSEVTELFTFESGPRHPRAMVEKILSRWGPCRIKTAPISAAPPASLRGEIAQARRVLFFCFEARRFAGQRAVLELVKAKAKERSVLCLIRGPWDAEMAPKSMTIVDPKGYRVAQLRAALDVILGGAS